MVEPTAITRNNFLVKNFDNLYFARLALSVSRYTQALSFISAHFTQGFSRDSEGQLRRMIVFTGNQALGEGGDKVVQQKFLIFDREELEIYSEINKRYVD